MNRFLFWEWINVVTSFFFLYISADLLTFSFFFLVVQCTEMCIDNFTVYSNKIFLYFFFVKKTTDCLKPHEINAWISDFNKQYKKEV